MTKHDEQNAAILDQFSKQAEEYTKLVAASGDRSLTPLFRALRGDGADEVLDVGCGSGRLALGLAPFVHRVTGVDLTPAMLDQARAQQRERGITNVTWRRGDVLPLEDADSRYDFVVSGAAFHHLADPPAVLREMMRVCRAGGRVCLLDVTPSAEKADAFNCVERLRDPSHIRAMTQDELRDLGRKVGLSEFSIDFAAYAFPAEAILKTSFPNPGDMERVRALYRDDAQAGGDRLGLQARLEDGQVIIHFPQSIIIWTKS